MAPRRLTRPQINELYARLAARDPAPTSALDYKNVFTLLVAVVLSAQATDAGVNKATRPLFETVDTPQKMVALGEAKLREAIRAIGLHRAKARHVIALSERLIAEHGGEPPNDRAALEALPGVGRKTANVVLNTAFGEPTIAVDTHVFRVANRLGLAPGETPLAVEAGLMKRTPQKWRRHAHHWLILHGRHVCKARKPACADCALADLCPYPGRHGSSGEPAPQGAETHSPKVRRRGRSARRADG